MDDTSKIAEIYAWVIKHLDERQVDTLIIYPDIKIIRYKEPMIRYEEPK